MEAGCGFVNCIPAFIAREDYWGQRFRKARLPIVGDDIKSQVGATIVHRLLTPVRRPRVKILRSSSSRGGNMDFYHMLERERLESKNISKTSPSVVMVHELPADDVYIGPSDYVPVAPDRKWGRIGSRVRPRRRAAQRRGEGRGLGPAELGRHRHHAVRCWKLAQVHGLAGRSRPPLYLMKSPPHRAPGRLSRASDRAVHRGSTSGAPRPFRARPRGSHTSGGITRFPRRENPGGLAPPEPPRRCVLRRPPSRARLGFSPRGGLRLRARCKGRAPARPLARVRVSCPRAAGTPFDRPGHARIPGSKRHEVNGIRRTPGAEELAGARPPRCGGHPVPGRARSCARGAPRVKALRGRRARQHSSRADCAGSWAKISLPFRTRRLRSHLPLDVVAHDRGPAGERRDRSTCMCTSHLRRVRPGRLSGTPVRSTSGPSTRPPSASSRRRWRARSMERMFGRLDGRTSQLRHDARPGGAFLPRLPTG